MKRRFYSKRLLLISTIWIVVCLGCGENGPSTKNESSKLADNSKSNEEIKAVQQQASERKDVSPDLVARYNIERMFLSVPDSHAPLDYAEFSQPNVKLVPPTGFVRAERFHGFKHNNVAASVMITTTPLPFESVTKDMIHTMINDPRPRFIESYFKDIEIEGTPAVYAFVVQPMENGNFAKHIIAFGNERKSWVINGIHPAELGIKVSQEILNSLVSVQFIEELPDKAFEKELSQAQESDVDFALTAPSMKFTAGWTKSIAFTKDGVFPLANPADPFYRAVPSVNATSIPLENRQLFLQKKLLPSPDHELAQVSIDREIEIDGLPGREILGLATDRLTDTEVLIYGAVLFEDDGYVLMNAWVGQDFVENYASEFQAITRSFKRTARN